MYSKGEDDNNNVPQDDVDNITFDNDDERENKSYDD